MRAEIAKTTYLPLPRWTAAASLGLAVVAGVLLFVDRPSNPGVESVAEALPSSVRVAALVMGVWIASAFSYGTWRRTHRRVGPEPGTRGQARRRARVHGAVPGQVSAGGFAIAASDAPPGCRSTRVSSCAGSPDRSPAWCAQPASVSGSACSRVRSAASPSAWRSCSS